MERNYMTVKELKEALDEFEDDLPVLMDGIYSGYDGFSFPFDTKVEHFPMNTYRDGEYEYTGGEENQIKVVILERTSRYD